MPLSPDGVNVSWYFIGCGEVLLTRMSDSNVEDSPSACATAGMISASGGGVFFGVFATGATRLTERFDVPLLPPSNGFKRLCAEVPPNVTVTEPVLVPT